MAYCTQADVETAAGGLLNLVDITNLPAAPGQPISNQVNVDVLTGAIVDADALIDSFVAMKRAVPLLPVPKLIRRISAEETVYLLRSRRSFSDIDQVKHDANVKWLVGFSRGENTLGVEPVPAKSSQVSPAVVLIGDLSFEGDRFKGLW